MNRRTPVATALLALFAAPAAWSQQATTILPEVTVRATKDSDNFSSQTSALNKLPPDLRDAPQSITVLNKALLKTQGANSLSDALRNVPGITLGGARFDATLAYHQPAWDVRLNVFNLTDKYYYDALIQSDGGRAVPATGRSAMLSFTYDI